jgi:hypothetical protein
MIDVYGCRTNSKISITFQKKWEERRICVDCVSTLLEYSVLKQWEMKVLKKITEGIATAWKSFQLVKYITLEMGND